MTETLSTLAAALVKAQGEFPPIEKRRTAKIGNQYSYKYADLGDVLKAVGPALRKNGLVLVFGGRNSGDFSYVTGTLLHDSGESITASLPLKLDDDPKQMGSRITYLRRYLAAMLCGVAADEDDDGTAAAPAGVARTSEGSGHTPVNEDESPNKADFRRIKQRLDTEFGDGGLYDKQDGTDELTPASKLKLKVLREAFGETKYKALMAMPHEQFHQMARDNFLPALEKVCAEAAQQEVF